VAEEETAGGLNLAVPGDREKLAGIIRAEFGINIAHDDPLFILLRIYQYTVSTEVEKTIEKLAEEKDSFGDLIDKNNTELARTVAVIIEAINKHADKEYNEKKKQLDNIGDDIAHKINVAVANRMDSIATQMAARIQINDVKGRYSSIILEIVAALLTSICTVIGIKLLM
jgi:hypothetical protein